MQKINKIIFILLLVSVAIIPASFSNAQEATSTPNADLQGLINELTEQIALLQAVVDELKTKESITKEEFKDIKDSYKFIRTLRKGATGEDVKELQEFLKQFTDIYPEGLVTGYFGPLTEKAVKNFQMKNEIVSSGDPSSTGFGQVGPQTRNKLNDLIINGAGKSGNTPPGLLTAPGLQDKISTTTAKTTGPPEVTPSGTIPATPAIPAEPPPVVGGGGGGATPAVPATPAESDPEPDPDSEPTEDTEALCSDEIDNDGDELIDLDDPDCSAFIPDTTPPVISNIQATNITETGATITWATDEPADSLVSHDTTSPIVTSTTTAPTAPGATDVTSHSITLSGLSSGTTYYFVVHSTDASDNSAISAEQSFTTSTPPPAVGWSENKRITNATDESYYPEIARSGSTYGIVWADYRDGGQQEVYFAILDSTGEKLVNDTRVTFSSSAHSRSPEIVWNGTDFAIVYDESNQMHFIRIDTTGNLIGSDVIISGGIGGDSPKIAWDGSGYGVTWHNGGFVYLDKDGNQPISPISLSNFFRPEIEWNGSDFGILYRYWTNGSNNQGGVTTYFRRIDSSGVQTLSDKTISIADTGTSFTWNGSVYGVTIHNGLFSTFDNNGIVLVDKVVITGSGLGDPDIIWNDSKFGIVGHTSDKIRFMEVNSDGSINVSDTLISTASSGQAKWPNIKWSGSNYGVVWHDSRDGNTEIYFATDN